MIPAISPAPDLVERIFADKRRRIYTQTDRMFLFLLLAQWILAIVFALVLSPYGWVGKVRSLNFHVEVAVLFGGVLNALPIFLIVTRPGESLTRHVVAATQMLWSAILIHLTGGRIETHFHVFGSLAFVAFYRDWRVLPTATVVVAGDHLVRGLLWPESVYGVVNPEWWRFLEHAAWVAFEDVVLVFGCLRQVREMGVMAEREAALQTMNQSFEREVVAKTTELRASLERFRTLVENTNSVPWEAEVPEGETMAKLTYVAPQAKKILGRDPEALVGRDVVLEMIAAGDRDRLRRILAETIAGRADDLDLEHRVTADDGRLIDVRTILSTRSEPGSRRRTVQGITFDITRQRKLEMELRQAQKLESVGRLAAGVAHEINTPVQFVGDSVQFVKDAMSDLSALIDAYHALCRAVAEGRAQPASAERVVQAEQAADLDYLMEHVPIALNRSLEGLERVASIVRSMKEFAHPDSHEKTAVDINRAIESTLSIARSEYKYVADLETDFGVLPCVTCHAGEFNQVILNIVINAAHAIGDVVAGTHQKGRIAVRTRAEGDHVQIEIEDTGAGIADSIRHHVFDPFFTTKEIGRGTGQGLAIARAVIVEKHGGKIDFRSQIGRGTTFVIQLPVEARPDSRGSAAA